MVELQWLGMALVMAMYFCIGFYPDSKMGWRFFFNVTSAAVYAAVGWASGLYSLVILQIFAVAMGLMQYRYYKCKRTG